MLKTSLRAGSLVGVLVQHKCVFEGCSEKRIQLQIQDDRHFDHRPLFLTLFSLYYGSVPGEPNICMLLQERPLNWIMLIIYTSPWLITAGVCVPNFAVDVTAAYSRLYYLCHKRRH